LGFDCSLQVIFQEKLKNVENTVAANEKLNFKNQNMENA
jgi:hypothetical protein